MRGCNGFTENEQGCPSWRDPHAVDKRFRASATCEYGHKQTTHYRGICRTKFLARVTGRLSTVAGDAQSFFNGCQSICIRNGIGLGWSTSFSSRSICLILRGWIDPCSPYGIDGGYHLIARMCIRGNQPLEICESAKVFRRVAQKRVGNRRHRQLRNPQAPEGAPMVGSASPLDLPLHAYISILAQRRRELLRQAHKAAIETWHLPVGRPTCRQQSTASSSNMTPNRNPSRGLPIRTKLSKPSDAGTQVLDSIHQLGGGGLPVSDSKLALKYFSIAPQLPNSPPCTQKLSVHGRYWSP
jgi:hypothetical protein